MITFESGTLGVIFGWGSAAALRRSRIAVGAFSSRQGSGNIEHVTGQTAPQLISPGYCPTCALTLERRYVELEGRERLICSQGHILYENPKIVAGTLPTCEGKIWLLKRAFDPRAGSWTFPIGFMELGETVEEAAIRETCEEIGVTVRLTGPARVYSHREGMAILIVFPAEASTPARALDEALEIGLFGPEEIPWDELAFWSTHAALRDWLASLEPISAASRPN